MQKRFSILRTCLALLFISCLFFQASAQREENDDPDMPKIGRSKMSKEEFMKLRAEAIGRMRGIEKNRPIDPSKRQIAVEQMKSQRVVQLLGRSTNTPSSALALPTWMPIGPAPIPNGQTQTVSTAVSGRVTAISVHPTNANIVYVGTAQGGVYRTTDGGNNWTPIMDGAASLAIGSIAISPSQPETVYVGTGEPHFSSDSYFGVGVYRIDNASTTATLSGPFNKDASAADIFSGRSIGKIIVHPTDPNTIFVASTSGIGGIVATSSVFPSRGIYRCTNATNASPVFAKLTGLIGNLNVSVRDMAIDPNDPNILVCVPIATGASQGGIYQSSNALAASAGSVTFTQRVVTNSTSTSTLNGELTSIHPSGDANATFYAAIGVSNGRVMRSTDGGVTWTTRITNGFCGGQCFYDIAIAVDPTNVNTVYLGGDPTIVSAKSINGGTTFTDNKTGVHADTHAMTVAPSDPTQVWLGTDGGIYKSTNSGVTWVNKNTSQFSATQFMSIATHPTDPNFSIGGTQDNGTNYYKPDGTWTRSDYGDGGYAQIDQNAADVTNVRMYHTYYNATNLQGYATTTSASAFENWTFRGCQTTNGTTNGITCNGAINFYAPLERGPGNPNTIYYGSDRLYRSANNGTNHTVVSQNPIVSGVPISAIGISPQDDNVRIVGLNDGSLYGTSTGASPLTNLDASNVVPNVGIARTVIDPNTKTTAYVTLSAFGVNSIWKTTNLSAANPTWTSASSGVPQVPVNSFVVDPANSMNLYAGTDIGVYASTDGGATWAPYGTGLPVVAVFGMATTAGNKLRIATHGKGMWEIAMMTASVAPTVTINQAAGQADPTSASPINFTVVFDQSVSDFATGDVTLGGTAGATTAIVTGSGTTYNVAVSGMTTSGTVIATIAAGVAMNADGDPNNASTSTDNTVTYNMPNPPAVTINQAAGQADPTSASPINFTVVFSQPVTGFTTGDVTLSGTAGATTGTITGSGTTYNVAVSGMTTSGTVVATIAAGVAMNAGGDPNNASTSTDNTVTYNMPNPPAVTINQAAGQADPTSASPINFTVVFSQPVTGFTTGDVTLSGTAGATTGTVTGSGTTYNVAVSGMTTSGTVMATIAAGVAMNAGGDPNTASTSTDNSVTYNVPCVPPTIDAPTVTQPTCGTPTGTIVVNASGSGPLEYSIDNGASYQASNTFSGLTPGSYNIKVRFQSAPTCLAAYEGNPVILSAATGCCVSPTVTINQAAAQADPTSASPINFTVVFSQAVADFATGDVTLSGTAGATTAIVTGSGTTYNVAVSGMTSSGTVIATIPANVASVGAGCQNVASTSTDNMVTFNTPNPPNVTINQAAGQADPTSTSPINFTVVFSQSVTGFTTGDVTLSGTAGATTGIVTGSGTTYNVAVSGMTTSGTVIATIAAGVAVNAGGDPNNASTSTDNTVTYNANCVLAFDGTLSLADPTFNRTLAFGQGGACTLSGVGTAVHYRTHSFTTTASGNLTVSLVTGDGASISPGTADTYLILYGPGGFNPLSTCTNAIAANDDAVGLLSRIITTTPLPPGTYTVVVSSFENSPSDFPWTYTLVAQLPGSCPTGCSPDNTPPTLVLKSSPSVNLPAGGTYTLLNSDVIQSLNDNCDPNPAVQISPASVSCADITKTPVVSGDYQAYNVTTDAGNQAWVGELGLTFRVDNPLGIVVKQLGAFDHEANGIMGTMGAGNNAIRVAIFNKTTQAIVPGLDTYITGNADAYAGGHRLKNISPVMLGPGEYVLVAKGYNALELNGNRNIAGIPINVADLNNGNSSISFIGSSYGDNVATGFSFPLNNYGPVNPWLAGTFKFDAATGAFNVTNTVSVMVTATDAAGNPTVLSTTVTVNDPLNVCPAIAACASDVTPPSVIPKNVVVNLDATGNATIVQGDVIQSLTDNCDPNPTAVLSRSSFSCADRITMPATAGSFQSYSVGTSTGNQGWLGELGLEFRVDNPQGILIKQLGAFDHQGNGITGNQGPGNNSVRVAIFNKATQTIVTGLDTYIAGNADAYTGNHRMKNITPVMLPIGNYVLVTKGYNGSELNGNRNLGGIPYSVTDLNDGLSAITFTGSSYGDNNATGFAYPQYPYAQINPWIAGTFKYDVPTGGTTIQNTVPITITAMDASGNTNVVNAIVTVEDPGGVCSGISPCLSDVNAPVLVAKNKTVQLSAGGTATIVPADVIQSLTDNCDPNPGVVLSRSSFNCSDITTVPATSGSYQAFNVNTNVGNQEWLGELGLDFQVANPLGIVVKQLGAFDHLGNGILGNQGPGNNSIHVAIFNKATQTIVPGLDVFITGNGDDYTGNHRMVNVPSVSLSPGDYVLVAKGYNASELNGNRNIFGLPVTATDLNNGGGAIVFTGSSYGDNTAAGFSYPAYSYAPVNPWLAGTMKFEVFTGGVTTQNTVPITITATDASGNIAHANATITVEDPGNNCVTPPAPDATVAPIVKGPQDGMDKAMQLTAFPNPATGQFTVQLSNLEVSEVTIQVTDQNGKYVAEKKVKLTGKTATVTVPFDLQKQASGMYIIKVISNQGLVTGKMMIAR